MICYDSREKQVGQLFPRIGQQSLFFPAIGSIYAVVQSFGE
jgi:hypothetical protein